MMRLVRNGLMFGNLYEVASPSMVSRYNRALDYLTGKRTGLQEFHIDISGYSPEIGDELGDSLYLNPNGCNRQFILLSVEQKTAPLLDATFSTSRDILRRYIDENEERLFALSIRDSIAGELINSVHSVQKPSDLFDIRTISVEADTVGGHVAAGDELADKITRFMSEPDAWWDDVLIAEMVELSKRTGDILHSPIALLPHSYELKNFYTTHFGGLFIFGGMRHSVCIMAEASTRDDKLPVDQTLSVQDRAGIAAFLEKNKLVEPILDANNVDADSILQQKLDFIAIDTIASNGADLSRITRRDLRRLKRKYHGDLPAEYHAIEDVLRRRKGLADQAWPSPYNPAYFYLLRSRNHANKALVNMLLAQMTPLDFRQLFICHKGSFYARYHAWSEAKKTYVAQFLADEYMLDKVGTREELFGPEPGMIEDVHDYGFGANMGPWGPVPAVVETENGDNS